MCIGLILRKCSVMNLCPAAISKGSMQDGREMVSSSPSSSLPKLVLLVQQVWPVLLLLLPIGSNSFESNFQQYVLTHLGFASVSTALPCLTDAAPVKTNWRAHADLSRELSPLSSTLSRFGAGVGARLIRRRFVGVFGDNVAESDAVGAKSTRFRWCFCTFGSFASKEESCLIFAESFFSQVCACSLSTWT